MARRLLLFLRATMYLEQDPYHPTVIHGHVHRNLVFVAQGVVRANNPVKTAELRTFLNIPYMLPTGSATHFFMAFALAFMAFILFMALGASAAFMAFMRFIGMVDREGVLAKLLSWVLSQMPAWVSYTAYNTK